MSRKSRAQAARIARSRAIAKAKASKSEGPGRRRRQVKKRLTVGRVVVEVTKWNMRRVMGPGGNVAGLRRLGPGRWEMRPTRMGRSFGLKDRDGTYWELVGYLARWAQKVADLVT